MLIDHAKTTEINAPRPRLPDQVSGIPGYACYRTVTETYADLAALAAAHPDIARWIDIGDTWDKATPSGSPGYDLNVLVLTNRAIPGPKPALFVMGSVHAREYVAAETATRFAEELVNGYGMDPEITAILDFSEVHILAQANPDGRVWAEQGYSWRKNTDSGQHLRLPHLWRGPQPQQQLSNGTVAPAPAARPRTRAASSIGAPPPPPSRRPRPCKPTCAPSSPTSAARRTRTPPPRTPRASWSPCTATAAWSSIPGIGPPGPRPTTPNCAPLGRKFGYYNGHQVCRSAACLYAFDGSNTDWAYGDLGVAAFTFEMGTAFFQSCASFESSIVQPNLAALRYAAKASFRPYTAPAGPEIIGLSVGSDTVFQGEKVNLSGIGDNTRYNSHGWGLEPVVGIAAAGWSADAPTCGWRQPHASCPHGRQLQQRHRIHHRPDRHRRLDPRPPHDLRPSPKRHGKLGRAQRHLSERAGRPRPDRHHHRPHPLRPRRRVDHPHDHPHQHGRHHRQL